MSMPSFLSTAVIVTSSLSSFGVCALCEAIEFKKERDVVYAQPADGVDLQLDAYLHPEKGLRPALVYIHGGGFVTGDKNACPSYLLEAALRRGYSVLSVNYRLAPKYPYPAPIDDVMKAVLFIRSQSDKWQIDGNRLILTGESAGGLISALVGATMQGDDKVAAVIPICGEVDLELRVSEDPCCVDMKAIPRPVGGCISGGLAAFLGFDAVVNDAQRQTLRAASAVTYVRREMPPYLLIHGTRDFGVPYEQSVSLQQAMLKSGADCTLLPVVGGGHVNWSNDQWHVLIEFAMDWLEQRLQRGK